MGFPIRRKKVIPERTTHDKPERFENCADKCSNPDGQTLSQIPISSSFPLLSACLVIRKTYELDLVHEVTVRS